jgi:hypothetical protein
MYPTLAQEARGHIAFAAIPAPVPAPVPAPGTGQVVGIDPRSGRLGRRDAQTLAGYPDM